MDNQVFDLVNRRSDSQDKKIDEILRLLREHIEKDEKYWKKLDTHEVQLSTLKWIFGGTVTTLLTAFWAWVLSVKG